MRALKLALALRFGRATSVIVVVGASSSSVFRRRLPSSVVFRRRRPDARVRRADSSRGLNFKFPPLDEGCMGCPTDLLDLSDRPLQGSDQRHTHTGHDSVKVHEGNDLSVDIATTTTVGDCDDDSWTVWTMGATEDGRRKDDGRRGSARRALDIRTHIHTYIYIYT